MATDRESTGSVRFAVAVHVMVLLALGDRPQNSALLAGSVDTNPVVIRRLLGLLHRAGLVLGRSGPRGGFRLARPAAAITLADVYRAVEAGGAAPARHRPNVACPVGGAVPDVLRRIGERAERAFLASLAGETLADTARRVSRRMGRAGAR
jgi:Rrf2 family protein